MLKLAIKDSVIYGLASLISKGMVIFLLPIYTRVLSPSDYGAYDLLITFGILINLIVTLEISQGLARHWADEDEGTGRVCLASTSLWFTVAMYAAFIVVATVMASQISILILGDIKYLNALYLGILFIAANGIYSLLLNQFRWELRSRAYMLASLLYSLLTLIFAIIFCFWMDYGLAGIMLAQLLATLVVISLCIWLLHKTFSFIFDFSRLFAMLRFSLPLVPASLAIFVSLYVNRLAIDHFGSLEDVGHFGIASRISSLVVLLVAGIQIALTPLVYQHYRNPQTPGEISKLFSWFMAVALVGCLFLTLFSGDLLTIFATNDFMPGSDLIVFLAPALLLSQMYIFAPGIGIKKKTNWQLYLTLLSAITSVLGNWLLVPLLGIWGAALATLLASSIFFLSWLALSQRLYPIPYDWYALLFGTLGFIFFAGIGIWFDTFQFIFLLNFSIKIFLLSCMLTLVIVCRLFTLTDMKNLLTYVRLKFYGEANL